MISTFCKQVDFARNAKEWRSIGGKELDEPEWGVPRQLKVGWFGWDGFPVREMAKNIRSTMKSFRLFHYNYIQFNKDVI